MLRSSLILVFQIFLQVSNKAQEQTVNLSSVLCGHSRVANESRELTPRAPCYLRFYFLVF